MTDFAKILVTTDFSGQALAGLEKAAALARRLDSEVVLLYVVEDHMPPLIIFTPEADRQEMLESHRLRAEDKLAEYAAEHLPGCNVATAAASGVPSAEIVRYADENEVDLIVMASNGYGPVRQLLLGSTTERVLHHANCPVLVIPSKEA